MESGEVVVLPAAKERSLLAVLALNAGHVVGADALVDTLWGDTPPATARKTLQTYVSNLRRTVGFDVLVTEGAGYRLRVDADAVDVWRFRTLIQAGEEALQRVDSSGAGRVGRGGWTVAGRAARRCRAAHRIGRRGCPPPRGVPDCARNPHQCRPRRRRRRRAGGGTQGARYASIRSENGCGYISSRPCTGPDGRLTRWPPTAAPGPCSARNSGSSPAGSCVASNERCSSTIPRSTRHRCVPHRRQGRFRSSDRQSGTRCHPTASTLRTRSSATGPWMSSPSPPSCHTSTCGGTRQQTASCVAWPRSAASSCTTNGEWDSPTDRRSSTSSTGSMTRSPSSTPPVRSAP